MSKDPLIYLGHILDSMATTGLPALKRNLRAILNAS